MIEANCPKDPSHERFITTAHVAEHWVVDAHGGFLWVSTNIGAGSEVVHGPDPGNLWSCVDCGAEAIVRYVD